jgi:hypothetical protein
MEMVTRNGLNMKKCRQQNGCYKLVVSQVIKKFIGFYEIWKFVSCLQQRLLGRIYNHEIYSITISHPVLI